MNAQPKTQTTEAPIEMLFNLSAAIDQLEASFDQLTDNQRKFADSLINGKWGYHARPEKFSAKQIACVKSLLDNINKKKQKNDDTPHPTEQVGELKALYKMFQKARESGLKYPKLHLEINGHVVKLNMSGPKSKFPDQINATDGLPFGENKWYGRVDSEGNWTQGYSHPEMRDVGTLLRCMSHDPKATAEQFGHLTGNCCFCNRPLKDEKSTVVGYGPVCAKKWGLSWG